MNICEYNKYSPRQAENLVDIVLQRKMVRYGPCGRWYDEGEKTVEASVTAKEAEDYDLFVNGKFVIHFVWWVQLSIMTNGLIIIRF